MYIYIGSNTIIFDLIILYQRCNFPFIISCILKPKTIVKGIFFPLSSIPYKCQNIVYLSGVFFWVNLLTLHRYIIIINFNKGKSDCTKIHTTNGTLSSHRLLFLFYFFVCSKTVNVTASIQGGCSRGLEVGLAMDGDINSDTRVPFVIAFSAIIMYFRHTFRSKEPCGYSVFSFHLYFCRESNASINVWPI